MNDQNLEQRKAEAQELLQDLMRDPDLGIEFNWGDCSAHDDFETERGRRKALLKKYLQKPVTKSVQFDVVFTSNAVYADYDCWQTETYDLMVGSDVRVLIRPGLPKDKVLHAVSYIATLIEEATLDQPEPHQPTSRERIGHC